MSEQASLDQRIAVRIRRLESTANFCALLDDLENQLLFARKHGTPEMVQQVLELIRRVGAHVREGAQ